MEVLSQAEGVMGRNLAESCTLWGSIVPGGCFCRINPFLCFWSFLCLLWVVFWVEDPTTIMGICGARGHRAVFWEADLHLAVRRGRLACCGSAVPRLLFCLGYFWCCLVLFWGRRPRPNTQQHVTVKASALGRAEAAAELIRWAAAPPGGGRALEWHWQRYFFFFFSSFFLWMWQSPLAVLHFSDINLNYIFARVIMVVFLSVMLGGGGRREKRGKACNCLPLSF